MFSRKKPEKPRQKSVRSGSGLSQFGLIDIPDLNNLDSMEGGLSDEDADLEAELLALTSNAAPSPLPRRVQLKAAPVSQLDDMIATSMRDIPSDESLSGDEDDPDLLEELSALTGEELDQPPLPETESKSSVTKSSSSQGQLLADRLSMYKEAEATAISVGETARARRYNRAIKTLGDLIKQAAAGKVIDEDDIPPPVSITASSKPSPAPSLPTTPAVQSLPTTPAVSESVPKIEAPTRVAPPPPVPPRSARLGVALPGLTSDDRPQPVLPTPPEPVQLDQPMPATASNEKDNTLLMLRERRDQYKRAALQAKKGGDTNLALTYVKVAKQFDTVISGVVSDQPVDLSAMPPPPPSVQDVMSNQLPSMRKRRSSENQGSSEPESAAAPVAAESEAVDTDVDQEYTVDMPKTVLEALEQRLAKYVNQEEAAKAENNSSKVRRMGRIVKQYNDAIKQHKAGKPVEFDDLPTPPGYPPIPVPGAAKVVSQPQISKSSSGTNIPASSAQQPQSPAKSSKLNISSEQDSSAEKINGKLN